MNTKSSCETQKVSQLKHIAIDELLIINIHSQKIQDEYPMRKGEFQC